MVIEYILVVIGAILITLLLAVLDYFIFLLVGYEHLVNTPVYYIIMAIEWAVIVMLTRREDYDE